VVGHRPDACRPGAGKVPARAFRYQRLLDEGRYASIGEMAAAERIERGYLGTPLRLTLLAPEIVEAVLDGGQADNVTLPRLLAPLPVEWPAQRGAFEAGRDRACRSLGDRSWAESGPWPVDD